MPPRVTPFVLLFLLIIFHVQIWTGRGSVSEVSSLQQKLDSQKIKNIEKKSTNERLISEINDLKEGADLVEEKARKELGMVRPNEIFVRVVPAANHSSQ